MNSFPIFFSILEVWPSSQFVWHLPRIFLSKECVCVCVHLSLGFTMVSNHTYLKMRASTECLLHVCHPEIVVQILSSRWISLFIQMDFFLGCNRWRIAAVVAAADTAAFEEAGISRFVQATVSRCMPEGLTFVSTLLESCEPYSWCSTAGLDDSKHKISKLSSFLRNVEP